MALQSQLLRGDPSLEAAAVSDPAHITPGARGPHVGKIQQALIRLDRAAINQDSAYGPATAAAVRAFKQKRRILNVAGLIDDIVGKKTIAALDGEMSAVEKGGGGSRLLLGFGGISTVTHTLIYFSGAGSPSLSGVPLLAGNRENVQIQMENIPVQNKVVLGFGGSRTNPAGVLEALAFVIGTHDPQGKLIVYGFSVGGVNALQLCRALNGAISSKVNLLITVDVPRTDDSGKNLESGVIPSNVVLNKNYFQTSLGALPLLTNRVAVGIRTTGRNIDCSGDSFTDPNPLKRHGQMEKVTQTRTIQDMRTELGS
jgi:hypothetical protein